MDPSVNAIVDWLRARMTAAAAKGLVVGLSGGVDSAVVVRLCQLAAPGQTIGLIMPCASDENFVIGIGWTPARRHCAAAARSSAGIPHGR